MEKCLREACRRRAAGSTSEAEAIATAVHVGRRQVERSVDASVAVGALHVSLALTLTSVGVTADIQRPDDAAVARPTQQYGAPKLPTHLERTITRKVTRMFFFSRNCSVCWKRGAILHSVQSKRRSKRCPDLFSVQPEIKSHRVQLILLQQGAVNLTTAKIPLGSLRLDTTRHVRGCRAHTFWLCRTCRTARLDTLETTSSTGETRNLVCCVNCIEL